MDLKVNNILVGLAAVPVLVIIFALAMFAMLPFTLACVANDLGSAIIRRVP